ncbi:thioredoxin family protein [Halobaculum sp. D14]|uniref:thioredoxin family protein n=1 Tax=unclassified Halobaculum TaxID=2640896 RepID=UPI003EB96AF8
MSESDAVSARPPRDVDARAFPDELGAACDDADLVLVEFYTKGCTLCQSMEPVLGVVSRAADVPVLTVNPQDDPSLVGDHDITSVPALLLFRADDGEPEEVGRLVDGFVGAERVVEFVEDHR